MSPFFVRKFSTFFAYLYRNYERINFESVKALPNVSIHDTFIYGEQSGFNITAPSSRLLIEEQTVCRKFCNFLVYANASVVIRKNVFFNNYCSVNCLGNIEIGENTLFGEGVKLYDHNHEYHFDQGKLVVERDQFKIGSIKIGSNCWIGSNVTILQNVEIGDNVIIGANCFIYKSIPSNSIVRANTEYTLQQS